MGTHETMELVSNDDRNDMKVDTISGCVLKVESYCLNIKTESQKHVCSTI